MNVKQIAKTDEQVIQFLVDRYAERRSGIFCRHCLGVTIFARFSPSRITWKMRMRANYFSKRTRNFTRKTSKSIFPRNLSAAVYDERFLH